MRRMGGFTLVEILVVVAIIALLASIAIPEMVGARGKANNASCEAHFHILDGELANQLDTALGSGQGTAFCDCSTNTCVVNCSLNAHADSINPRLRSQPLYVPDDVTGYTPCQVILGPYETTGAMVTQSINGTETRTFSIIAK